MPEVLLDQFSGRVLRLLLGSSPTGTGPDEAMSSPTARREAARRHPSRNGHPLACAGVTGEESGDGDRLTRRELVRRAAKVGAVVWTAPLIIDSLASPAAAATCPPGNYNVVYQGSLSVRSPASGTGCTASGTNLPTAALVASTVGLTATGGPITHLQQAPGQVNPVRLTISTGCSCRITSVYAHVHRIGASTSPDCPNPACQPASAVGSAPLRVTAGALGSGTVTVAPNQPSLLCGGVGIHWGSPNRTNGYMVVNVTCG